MSKTVVSVQGISKLYRLGEVGTGTISQDLNRWWANVRGKEDPMAKIGELNDRASKGGSDFVWSLRNINFEVKQGEVLGIVGRNGAGKSTLLKVLSKVTAPTEGKIKIKGRIASLLEVGTGIHPELTGRENIFLNGAILGMTKGEIWSKFDQIVDFAGVERYIDTPVKRYSSGMYVRLAFAVAAFLEPEILIVDEVLAVGDAEFQKKCLGRMKDVSVNEGRTVLFVSHNMAAVKQLCTRGIILNRGTLALEGDINTVVDQYLRNDSSGVEMAKNVRYFTDMFKVNRMSVNGTTTSNIASNGKQLIIDIEVEALERMQIDLEINIKQEDVILASFGGFMHRAIPVVEPGAYNFNYVVNLPVIRSGLYQVDIMFSQPYTRWWAILENIIELEIHNTESDTFIDKPGLRWGKIQLEGSPEIKVIL